MKIFNDNFLGTDPDVVMKAIRSDGFFYLENALSEEWLESLKADVAANGFTINRNWISSVYAENQFYLTHILACSRAFYKYVTHSKVFDICEKLLGNTFRLKAIRYYETYGNHHMQWHTDNKTDRGFAHIPGLIFITYISDVTDGEFQYVRGSQNWSGEKAYSDYTDEFIEKNHGKDVVSFKAPRGTLLVYDTYGIHRGKPVFRSGFTRKSLFFQVDNKVDSAEPLLINPSLIDAQDLASERVVTYLGFGRASEYAVFPDTSLKNLQLRRLPLCAIARWLGYRIARTLYELAPQALKNAIRRMAGKPSL